MLTDFLTQAEIPDNKNQLPKEHKTFSLLDSGDMLITYQNLEGNVMQWKRKRDQRSIGVEHSGTMSMPYTRKRLLNASDSSKYKGSSGQPAEIFLNGLHAYNRFESDTLVITEGEKKAFVGCAYGVATVGAAGIFQSGNSNRDAAGQKNPTFLPTLIELMQKMQQLKNVILLFDADCREGSEKRRAMFASAVINFSTACQSYKYDFTFAHIKEDLPKGLDDLFIDRADNWDAIANDLIDQNLKSPYFSFIRLKGAKPKLINAYFSGALTEDERNPELWKHTESAFYGGQLEEAEMLIKLFKDKWKYNATLARWMRYEGGKWHSDDKSEKLLSIEVGKKLKTIYNKFKALLINDIDPKAIEKKEKTFSARMIKISGSAYLSGLANLMQANAVNENDMNNDPYTLNCKNGELDIRTGQLNPHSPDSNTSRQCLAVYDPEAKPAESFLEFVNYILEDDTEMLEFFQTWAGICLSGLSDWQAFIYAYGGGSNGKSTIARVLSGLLGDYATMLDIEVIMGNGKSTDDYKIAMTKGARLVVGSEISKGYAMNEAKIKSITGGDKITARPIFGKPIEFEPTAKYFFYGNHKLTVRGQDDGIWRRIYMTEFMRPIQNKRAMTDVLADFAKEYSGILNWCVEGFQKFYNNGKKLDKPAIIAKATDQYKRDNDILADFLEEQIVEISNKTKPLYLSDIYVKYAGFCESRREDKGFRSPNTFKKALTERGFEFYTQTGDKRKNGLLGYDFTENVPEPVEYRNAEPMTDTIGNSLPDVTSSGDAPF